MRQSTLPDLFVFLDVIQLCNLGCGMSKNVSHLLYGKTLNRTVRLLGTVDQYSCESVPKLVEAENRVMLVVAKKYDILYRLWFYIIVYFHL